MQMLYRMLSPPVHTSFDTLLLFVLWYSCITLLWREFMLNRCPMCLFKELRCRPQYLCKGNVHVVFMHDGCHIRDMIYSLLKHHARCFVFCWSIINWHCSVLFVCLSFYFDHCIFYLPRFTASYYSFSNLKTFFLIISMVLFCPFWTLINWCFAVWFCWYSLSWY